VGQDVDRLDNYKRDGRIMAINRERGRLCILVRWPQLEDQWCSPELLVPKVAP
jgi:hypothetical protein